jgi:hypothetical protein
MSNVLSMDEEGIVNASRIKERIIIAATNAKIIA